MKTFTTIRSSVGTDDYDTYVDLEDDGIAHYLLATCLRISLEAQDQLPEVDARELAELMVVMSDMKLESCREHADQYQNDPPWTLGAPKVIVRVADIAFRTADALETGQFPIQADSTVTEMVTELRNLALLMKDAYSDL